MMKILKIRINLSKKCIKMLILITMKKGNYVFDKLMIIFFYYIKY